MDGIRAWSRSIVISVIITIVIEMILPENNSKKYIKIILGIFVVYSIISPVFEYFSVNSVDSLIDNGEAVIEASSSNVKSTNERNDYTDLAVRNIYVQSLQTEISKAIENNGYIPEKINIDVANDDTYNINEINIKIREKKEEKNGNNNNKQAQSIVETVKQIVISIDSDDSNENKEKVINESDISKIKKLISEKFGVKEHRINIF